MLRAKENTDAMKYFDFKAILSCTRFAAVGVFIAWASAAAAGAETVPASLYPPRAEAAATPGVALYTAPVDAQAQRERRLPVVAPVASAPNRLVTYEETSVRAVPATPAAHIASDEPVALQRSPIAPKARHVMLARQAPGGQILDPDQPGNLDTRLDSADTVPNANPEPVIDPDQPGNLNQRLPAAAPDTNPSPVIDPDQPGNLDQRLSTSPSTSQPRPVLDPNQVGNLQRRIQELEQKTGKDTLPLIRLSGFMQLDQGLFSQSDASRAVLGDIQDGVGFRRTRLQAIGKLTEQTGYSIEMDFATIGRPSFMDVWGEQSQIPFFGTIRIGQFRQPGTMDGWTSIRHLEFLERSLPFQALDPFRRVGIMAYDMSENERTTWAYSVYATGLTFFNGTNTTYSTLGDTRAGTQIGDSGGVSFASRVTHLLYYDEPAEGRYLLHVGGGYHFSELGGEGTSGPFAKTYNSRPIPEFFVGDPAGVGLTVAGTPVVVDSGRILATSVNFYHLELAGNYGAAHFQSEFMISGVNQLNGPTIVYPGAYFQGGYFLTGENAMYLKQAGVLDYNVVPYRPFISTGRKGYVGGWGAWEVAFRWSWLDLDQSNLNPENQLSNSAGPPPAPNPGVVNESTLALNWWWNRFTRVQFNWIHSMPNYTRGGYSPFDIYAARFQIEF